jgi:cobyrinic acid a,c-diamide synthase
MSVALGSRDTIRTLRLYRGTHLSVIVVAGTHSGVGKTTVALGLMQALRERGLVVQPFKVGPDFVDPAHHTAICGRASRNLDGWLFSREQNLERFARYTADADVAVIEGVMGLFDGRSGDSEAGSTAEIAKWLGVPVLLVVDADALARSAGAVVHGFTHFDPGLDIAGVVLNRVAGPGHATMIEQALAGLPPLLGSIERDDAIAVPERHLGLVMPSELPPLPPLGEVVDLDRLLGLTRVARRSHVDAPTAPRAGVRIGVARDDAFCFYYPENLELLEEAGADLVEFSPVGGRIPADLDGLYLGGGYPELHAAALSANIDVLSGIRELAAAGRPVLAECGGLMYVGETLEVDGHEHRMCGLLPLKTRMCGRLSIGYVEVETEGLLGRGVARGHAFHYSELSETQPVAYSYRVRRADREVAEGFSCGNVLASYVHLHFATNPGLAARFVDACAAGRVR